MMPYSVAELSLIRYALAQLPAELVPAHQRVDRDALDERLRAHVVRQYAREHYNNPNGAWHDQRAA